MMCGRLKDRAEAKLTTTIMGGTCVEVTLYGCGSGPGVTEGVSLDAAEKLLHDLEVALYKAGRLAKWVK